MLSLCSKEIADSSPGRHFLTMLARMRTLSERFDVLTILHQTVVSEILATCLRMRLNAKGAPLNYSAINLPAVVRKLECLSVMLSMDSDDCGIAMRRVSLKELWRLSFHNDRKGSYMKLYLESSCCTHSV